LRHPPAVRAGDTIEVSVEVENAGSMTADEVVQLYVSTVSPPSPEGRGGQGVRTERGEQEVRTLAGFRRVALRPGERTRLTFSLVARSAAFTIAVGGKQPGFRGVADAGTTEVLVGTVEVDR
jgi:beta-glucosidase